MSRRIALATCLPMPAGDDDELPLAPALAELGFEVSMLPWDQPGVDWNAFDATVIRATWNYTSRREDFLAWAASIPRLHNPLSVIEANSDKSYLVDLAAAGLPVIDTRLVPPGAEPELPRSGEFVLKPSVGAGSRGAGRFDAGRPGALDAARAHVRALHDAGRTVLMQPYHRDVDTAGETALMYFDGVYSHAIRKGPMLPPDVRHPVHGRAYVSEDITARQPSEEELAVAEKVLAHANAGLDENLLYARIDLLPGLDGSDGPVVGELELVEPSLYLTYSDTAAGQLAAAISARVS